MSRQEAKSLRRENLELMLEKKKQCTTKALECVETLIELNVLENTFRQTLPYINQSTYQDVVDERSITYVCGYPLCSSQLKNIPKKQYSIVRCNGQLTLFDTVERKKFCSNICYKASKFIHDQLPTCPLWLIETKENDQFSLIPLNSSISRCSYGEEINMNAERPVTEQERECQVTNESLRNQLQTGKSENSSDKESPVTNKAHNNQLKTNNSESKCDKESSVTNKAHNDQLQTCNSENSSDNSFEDSKPSDQSRLKDEEQFFDSCNTLDVDDVNLETSKHELDRRTSTVENNINLQTSSTDYNSSNESSSEKTNEYEGDKRSGNLVVNCETEIGESISQQASEIRNESNLKHGEVSDENIVEVKTKCVVKNTGGVESHLTTNEGNRKENVKTKKKKLSKAKYKDYPDQSPILAAVRNTEQKIREWVSVETLNFILGSEKLRNILEEHGLLDKLKTRNIDSAQDPYLFERYIEICTKLNILDMKDAKFDKEVREEAAIPTKPLPDFNKLREEAKAMELKVRSFYAGDKRVQFTDRVIEESETKREKVENVLPLVDQHAQHAFRRRIVLDHLNKVLPDVMKAVGISNLISKKDVRDLVHTFTLSANNVVFKPIEWQFIAIIIIKLFSVRDEGLAKLLSTEKARKYITLILMSYEQDSEYLDRLMTWLLYEHSLFRA